MQVIENQQQIDFGLMDFILQRMTFSSQDQLRLMISKLGHNEKVPINLYSVYVGLSLSLTSFSSDFGCMRNEFAEFNASVVNALDEVSKIYAEYSLIKSSIVGNKLKLKKWLILEELQDRNLEADVLKYVGAYFSLILNNQKVNKQLDNVIYKLINYGTEFISEQHQRDLARMLYKANCIFFEKEKTFEETIKGFFFYRNFYAAEKTRQSVIDWHAMSRSEFISASSKIYEKANSGNHNAIVIAIAALAGLPLHLINEVPLINEAIDDWVISIDIERGLILFDLAAIYPSSAKPGSNYKLYEQSGSIVVKPMPKFICSILQKYIVENPNSKAIGELLKCEVVGSLGFDVSRLINSVARFAVAECKIDQYEAAILSSDFRSIPSAKTYYRRTTRQSIWVASNRFFQEVGWGESVDYAEGLSVGSAVVAIDKVVHDIFKGMANTLEVLRPSNRTSIAYLLKFHDHFCAYTATYTIFCLALRNSNPIGIKSEDFDENKQYIVVDDKHVLGEASALPIAISDSLHQQLVYWKIHCQCMHNRLSRINYDDKKFLDYLEGITSQKGTPLFICSAKPYALSVAGVAEFWNMPLVENFARHFWETKFSKVGVSSRFSATQLRHQSSGCLSWASDSDFVLSEFVKQISVAQEAVLVELNVRPVHGISKRFQP